MTRIPRPIALPAHHDRDGGDEPREPVLRWLHVRQFRNLAQDAALTFHDGLHLLLGAADDRRALLQLIAAALSGDFHEIIHEEFSVAYELEREDAACTVVLSHRRKEAPWMAALPSLSGAESWDDRVDVFSRGPSGSATFRDARTTIRNVDLFEPSTRIAVSVFEPLHVYFNHELFPVDGPYAPGRAPLWARSALCTGTKTRSSALLSEEGLRSTPYLLARFVRTSTTDTVYHAGVGPLFERAAAGIAAAFADAQVHDVLEVPFWRRGLPFTLVQQLGMRQAWLQLAVQSVEHLGAREPGAPGERVSYDRASIRFERHDGTYIDAAALAPDERRIATLALHLWEFSGPVVADAMLDTLDASAISTGLDAMTGRQTFLSTDDPAVVDAAPMETADDIQRAFLRCSREPGDGDARARWRALTTEEAAAVDNTRREGATRLSGALRRMGHW